MDPLSGVVIYTCDPSTKDAETSLDYRELEACLNCIAKPCFRKQTMS